MSFAKRRRLFVALVAGGGVLLVLIGVGVLGLLRGPSPERDVDTRHPIESDAAAPPVAISKPRPVAATSNPVSFARSVARAVFDWDTRATGGPADWEQPLVDAADPDEAAGVAADVRGYLPSSTVWEQLEAYGTRQSLTIDDVRVPDAWTAAQAQAAAGQIPATAVAFTVNGTRHREGMWRREPVQSARPVSFTVFVDCPADEPCRLLRLSRPDSPLE
ncbi:hypothetical protein J7E25_05485 [Agromyces sp. ISL-38]|uniref:hypothetical protein n=1 Tax=Agromyces sp. ISL-38 TaxID=2819107 RepID=UPI001BE5ADDF|nr:hypothetical protein [Agromyces sp. ISL-38]MBT2498541.1 hypothetical protein [Agromyces sp. ISL-38]